MYELAKQILEETNGQICKHCLGRKLSHSIEGMDNLDRGEKIFKELDIKEPESCEICGNIFNKIDEGLFKKVYDNRSNFWSRDGYFLVQCKKQWKETAERLS